jgi:hypothetical protein
VPGGWATGGRATPAGAAATTASRGIGSNGASGTGFGIVGLGEIGSRIRSEPARPRVRLLLALAGWPPLGLALALGIGELTGCARFAATCTSTSEFSSAVLLAQVAVLAVLLLVPAIARVAAFGGLAILVAALPIVAFLTAAGATYDPAPGTAALLWLLTAAWGVGVLVGLPWRSHTMPR